MSLQPDQRLVSADDHMDIHVMPPDLWQTRLPRSLRERGPKVVETDDGDPTVVSGWGERSQWCRNVLVGPQVFYTVRRTRRSALAQRLTEAEALAVFERYRRVHPRAARALGAAIDVSLVDDIEAAARRLPVFRLRPRAG